jgi:hypothetical protein
LDAQGNKKEKKSRKKLCWWVGLPVALPVAQDALQHVLLGRWLGLENRSIEVTVPGLGINLRVLKQKVFKMLLLDRTVHRALFFEVRVTQEAQGGAEGLY